jgi:hypothetical protein
MGRVDHKAACCARAPRRGIARLAGPAGHGTMRHTPGRALLDHHASSLSLDDARAADAPLPHRANQAPSGAEGARSRRNTNIA